MPCGSIYPAVSIEENLKALAESITWGVFVVLGNKAWNYVIPKAVTA